MMNYRDTKKYIRTVSTVRYIEERPFIIAIVELDVSSETFAKNSDYPKQFMVVKGLSTCSPTDHWDTKRGEDVARGRAEAKLARQVMRMMTQRMVERATEMARPTITIEYDVKINGEEPYYPSRC